MIRPDTYFTRLEAKKAGARTFCNDCQEELDHDVSG